MWRINGLSLACLLVLCALLLTKEVRCQDEAADDATAATDAPADAGDTAAAQDTASDAAPDAADATGGDSAATPAPTDGSLPFTVVHVSIPPMGGMPMGGDSEVVDNTLAPVIPDVKCVGKEDIVESNAVKASVTTTNCAETKNIIEAVPGNWCSKQACKINIFQDDGTVLLYSEDASLGTVASALQSEQMKNQLGVSDVKYSSSSGSSVLAGILVTGLLGAIALTVGYFKCQRRPSPKGERLAEEGTPVDQQNQANTLASDAPLNPPPETPEKPSANGEAPEGDKTQPPPTNGHSTPANTADTEL